jgi:hypothetical protein
MIMVTAAMDSTALFHDMAQGASAVGAGVVAVIAAASALREVRGEMISLGALPIMFSLLQGEAYDFIGSRRLFADIASFHCRKLRPAGDGAPNAVCLDPPMLAPEIEQLNTSTIDFVLHVDQPLPRDGNTLYLHTGCTPSLRTQAVSQLLLKGGGGGGGC